MSMFIVVTTAIMIIVLILFNIAMRIYLERNARQELRNIFTTMNILVERQLMNAVIETDKETVLINLSAALTATRLSGNTEFYIFDEGFQLKFPEDTAGTLLAPKALNNGLLKKIAAYDFSQNGALQRVRAGGSVYLIAGMTVDEVTSGRLYVVFLAGMAKNNALIGMINLLLIAIMLVALGIGIFYATSAAKSLTRPIQKVSAYAREIGNGRFITVPPDDSTQETSDLIVSINEMSGRLMASDQAQKSFLQNASHELRTPLMSIQGYSEAIENGIGPDAKAAAAIIKAESIRLTTLVEELITLSKIDSNIYDSAFGQLDLAEAISDCVDRLNGLALKEHIKITPILQPGVMISGDETLLTNAMMNVMSNGIRYAKTAVTVSLTARNGRAIITISDDGDGFSGEDLPHAFERFYKGRGGKFGLGLAIAKRAAEIMGGTITAKNGDTGAVFEITLPLV